MSPSRSRSDLTIATATPAAPHDEADPDGSAERFEAHRRDLRAVAYRMLGSLNEADDAVQEAWLRFYRADVDSIDNLGAWLTTVVGRVCLNRLRSRQSRPEEPLDVQVPDPILSRDDIIDPEQAALVGDSVGLALLVVLGTLTPAERVAFVLHDIFAVPFDLVADVAGRSPAAVRQLASRARRRVHATPTVPDVDLAKQRQVVGAFMAAAEEGDFDALVAVLDPDVVIRTDGGPGTSSVIRGAVAVARGALAVARRAAFARPVLVNGVAGLVAAPDGRPVSLMAFTVGGGRIVAIDTLADRQRLGQLDLTVLDD
jgi:RNA polymerase sigma factor (sigma-70 family)